MPKLPHLFLSCLVVGSSGASAQAARFDALGGLPGARQSSTAEAVSADGAVVVGSSASALQLGAEAFLWTEAEGMVGLVELPEGIVTSDARAVSGDGSLVGGFASVAGTREAFFYTDPGGLVAAGDLPGAGVFSSVMAISDDGRTAVGFGHGLDTPMRSEAVEWTEGVGPTPLGFLPGNAPQSRADDVSADGRVIVGRSNSASDQEAVRQEAVRWVDGSGPHPLSDLPGGGFSSRALGVSADGAVVVGRGCSGLGLEAFRWTEQGGMEPLGELPGCVVGDVVPCHDPNDLHSEALATSGDGRVVVGKSCASGGTRAFLWDPDARLRDLQTVLETEYDIRLPGWVLTAAVDISPDGLTIVGNGVNPDGNREAWRVFLPEPSACAPVALALTGILASRRRNRRARGRRPRAEREPF